MVVVGDERHDPLVIVRHFISGMLFENKKGFRW